MPYVSRVGALGMLLLGQAAVDPRLDRAGAADMARAGAHDPGLVLGGADEQPVAADDVAAVLGEARGPQRDEREDRMEHVVGGVDRDEPEGVVAAGDPG